MRGRNLIGVQKRIIHGQTKVVKSIRRFILGHGSTFSLGLIHFGDYFHDLNMVKTEIIPSEHWNGFTYVFSNGWSVSVQQSENHYCTVGKTVEVAIFDPQDRWYVYDEKNHTIEESEVDTYVNGWIDADHVARIISIISQKEVDNATEA